MFPSSPKSPVEVPTQGARPSRGAWGGDQPSDVGFQGEARSAIWAARAACPLATAAPASQGPAIPGKKGELHYPTGLPSALFPFTCLCTWPEEGGAWTSPSTFSFPCVRAGSFFFLPLLPPPPAPLSLLPLPSLPPPLGWVCALGAPGPLAAGTRLELRGRGIGSPSLLPPFSFPAPFPTPPPPTRARSGGLRNPEVSISPTVPPPPPNPPVSCSHLSLGRFRDR